MSEQSKSELYSYRQALFDESFADIIVKTWVGFDRCKFDALADNDPVDPSSLYSTVSINYHGQAAEELIEDIECGYYELPEGCSLTWSDGTPLPVEPNEGP